MQYYVCNTKKYISCHKKKRRKNFNFRKVNIEKIYERGNLEFLRER